METGLSINALSINCNIHRIMKKRKPVDPIPSNIIMLLSKRFPERTYGPAQEMNMMISITCDHLEKSSIDSLLSDLSKLKDRTKDNINTKVVLENETNLVVFYSKDDIHKIVLNHYGDCVENKLNDDPIKLD